MIEKLVIDDGTSTGEKVELTVSTSFAFGRQTRTILVLNKSVRFYDWNLTHSVLLKPGDAIQITWL